MLSVSFIANIVLNDELKCPPSSHARSSSVRNAIRTSLNQSHSTLTWCDVVLDSKHLKTTQSNSLHSVVPIYEAAQGGYRANAGVQHGGADENQDSDSSDGYGCGSNDGGGGGIGGGEGGSGSGRDDDDVRGRRSAFTDTESEKSDSDSEDDVPLAQRIPGALQAQKSIRVKERERRRRERAARAAKPQANELVKRLQPVQIASQRVPSSRTVTGTATQPTTSPPTLTLRRPAAYSSSVPQPRHVSLEEPRMRHVSAQETSSPLHAHSRSRNPSLSKSPQAQAQLFSRNGVPRKSGEDYPPQQPLLRNGTRKSAGEDHTQQHVQQQQLQQQQHKQQQQQQQQQPAPPPPQQQEASVARARTLSSGAVPRRVLQRARTSPMPPLPTNTQPQPQSQAQKQGQDTATQLRFFIGDMQRFNTVAINPGTCARDVLDLVRARGELEGSGEGGWMVWELAQDFGMERPLREYELPAEVYASWNSNTRLNAFMIKKTPLAAVLARTAMPASSPRCSGYVRWESKRGKWNKRWMELREHSLWLSKRDTGKDETFLCSLSNFDCYYVSRLHKAPKTFVFAVKSTDNLTLFENPADYLHVFACDQRDGQQWMERILLARSYVLYKERTVLFTTPSNPASSNNASSSNSSSHAHKSPPSRPGQGTLVNLDTMQSPVAMPMKGPFQSGSLLSKTSV